LDELFDRIRRLRISVIGDLMLDRYVWGTVERISPEAPVPIVSLTGESSNLGGAANVAANVSSIGAEAALIGVVGDDPEGELLCELVRTSGFDDRGIFVESNRPTSVKTRVIAHNQHVVRIDREKTIAIEPSTQKSIIDHFKHEPEQTRAVIIEDYNKGVLSPSLIHSIITESKNRSFLVGVDPKKENFWDYKGVTLFKPNQKELEIAVNSKLKDDASLVSAGQEVKKELDIEYLLITRGEHGMALFHNGEVEFIQTKAHRVHDVSGAGDTVIATMMTALAAGADIMEASLLSSYAASIVIAEIGAVPVDASELRRVTIGR
jgi:D-beta-D-heptose 7-phosphate kinase/D-beta-D-heptose 1-phosphate adenosyltransferase